MSRPLCRDCEHFHRAVRPFNGFGICARIRTTKSDLVTGDKFVTVRLDPWDERKEDHSWFGLRRQRCGPEGIYFEPARPSNAPSGGSGVSK